MTKKDAYEELCYHDKRNPMYYDIHSDDDDDEAPEPRKNGCGCDNCFYGRDKLALEILHLMSMLNGKP